MTSTIILVLLMIGCLAAIGWNLAAGWQYHREARRAARVKHTIALVGETGDGDTYPVATFQGYAPATEQAHVEWENTTAFPVVIVGWVAMWEFAGMSDTQSIPVEETLEPGGRVALHSRFQMAEHDV